MIQAEADALGVEVLDMCDGQKTVRYIADSLARRHRINPKEAEAAVGLLHHQVDDGDVRPQRRDGGKRLAGEGTGDGTSALFSSALVKLDDLVISFPPQRV